LAIFDGDGTLWRFSGDEFSSSWGLVKKLLSKKEKEIWTKRSKEYHENFEKQNNNSYGKFLKKQIEMLKGKNKLRIENICYVDGAKEFIDYLKGQYYEIWLISAGFYDIVEKASKELGINSISNFVETKDSVYTGKAILNITAFNKHQKINKLIQGKENALIFFDLFDFSIIKNNFKNSKKVLIYDDSKNEIKKAREILKIGGCDIIAKDFFQVYSYIKEK